MIFSDEKFFARERSFLGRETSKNFLSIVAKDKNIFDEN